jgi:hypothetical protein
LLLRPSFHLQSLRLIPTSRQAQTRASPWK